MNTQDVISAVLRGDLDTGIKSMYAALREREKIVRTINAATFKATVAPGKKVRITGIRPAYLKGQLATISPNHRGGNRVEITLFHDIGRFRAGSPLAVPASCLEVVPDDTPVPAASAVPFVPAGDDDGDMD